MEFHRVLFWQLVLVLCPSNLAAVPRPGGPGCDQSDQTPAGRPGTTCPCQYQRRSLDGGMVVDCRRGHLVAVPKHMPVDSVEVWLNSNDITSVGDELSGFDHLTFLHMEFNDISSIAPNAFTSLHNLTELYLNNNTLSSTSLQTLHIFSGLTSLWSLTLSGNNIMHLGPGVFTGLHSLQWLYLEGNGLVEITQETFSGLGSLQVLDLRYNELRQLPVDVFKDTPELITLHLSYNPLQTLPVGVVDPLTKLSVLDLSHCSLRHLSAESLSGLDSLASLQLNSNQFQRVPEFKLEALESLDLGDNPIETIHSGCFAGLGGIKWISLFHLPALEVVEQFAFANLSELQGVGLNDNPVLDTIKVGAFQDCPRLTSVRLQNNALFSLDEALLDWESLDGIHLNGNPWNCDCNLKWLHYLLNYADPSLLNGDILCTAPREFKGHRVQDVHPDNFNCSKKRGPKASKPDSNAGSLHEPARSVANDIRAFLTFIGIILGTISITMIVNVIQKYRRSRSKNPPPEGAKVATTFTPSRKRFFRFQRMDAHGSEEDLVIPQSPCDV